MKKFTIIYRTHRGGNLLHTVVMDYSSKRKLKADFRGNGLRVLAILTDMEIAVIKIQVKNPTEIYQEYVQQVL